MHLNDYDAFKKALPSKIFELAMFKKPILAGVKGYARAFLNKNLPESIVFNPGNAKELSEKLTQWEREDEVSLDRNNFIEKFNRKTINRKMAASILSALKY